MGETINLILRNLKEDYHSGKDKIKDWLPKLKKYVIIVCSIFLASFLLTIPVLILGIARESKTIIVLAGVVRAAITFIFLILMSPIGVALETIKDGITGSLRRYINFVKGVCISELFVAVILAWLPLKNNKDMIIPVIVLFTILTLLGSKFISRKVSVIIVVLLLFLSISSFFIPNILESFGISLWRFDTGFGLPKKVNSELTCEKLRKDEYPFFDRKGNSLVYYYRNWKTHEIDAYRLTSKNTVNPSRGGNLLPITPDVRNELEEQVCHQEEKAAADEEKRKKEAALEEERRNAQNNSGPNSQLDNTPAAPMIPQTPVPAPETPTTPPPVANRSVPEQNYESSISRTYHLAILPAAGTGNIERYICERLAKSFGMLYAGQMGLREALQRARLVAELGMLDIAESQEGNIRTCQLTATFTLKDSLSGVERHFYASSQVQRAFDSDTARRFALNAMIESAKIKFEKL